MAESLTDQIKSFFDGENIDDFKDKNYKRDFIDKITKQTNGNRNTTRITLNNLISKKIKDDNLNSNDFVKSRGKKFSSKLDIQSDTKKVNVEDPKDEKKFPTTQNPKGKLGVPERRELPLDAVAGAGFSFLNAIFDDLEVLTDDEKKDMGVCLDLAFGDYINTHDNAKKVFGCVGLLGIVGGKIKKARVKKKVRKDKKKVESEINTPVITENDRNRFQSNSQEFIEEKVTTDI